MKVCLACGHRFAADDWRCPSCGQSPQLLHGYPAFAPDLAKGNTGFNEEHFAQLAEVEAGNFWFRSRNRLLIWALQRYFPRARSFLELGCGTGFVLSGIQRELLELSVREIFLLKDCDMQKSDCQVLHFSRWMPAASLSRLSFT